MKQNTTIIGNEEYYQLRKFKDRVIGGYAVQIWNDLYSGSQYFYYSPDEMAERLLAENSHLKDKLLKLRDSKKPKEETVSDIKKMSIWQFIKWRRK